MATRIKKLKSYYINRHSCYLLKYHLVLTTSGNEAVFTPELTPYLNEFITSMMSKNECELTEIRYDGIHAHILFDAPIILNLPNFVNGMKSTSSRMLRRKFDELVNQYVGENGFWLRSYLLMTQSENTQSIIDDYIQNEMKK